MASRKTRSSVGPIYEGLQNDKSTELVALPKGESALIQKDVDRISKMTKSLKLAEPLPLAKEKIDAINLQQGLTLAGLFGVKGQGAMAMHDGHNHGHGPGDVLNLPVGPSCQPNIISSEMRAKINKIQKLAPSLEWRIKTFSEPWPYPHNTKKLNGTTLAKAGFIRGTLLSHDEKGDLDVKSLINLQIQVDDEEDDSVFCPFCFKSLTGFEGSDMPFSEHQSHQSNCVFINQLKSKRARTSLWMDPLKIKNLKVQTNQNMKSCVSTAHNKKINSDIEEYLEDKENLVQNCNLSDIFRYKGGKGSEKGVSKISFEDSLELVKLKQEELQKKSVAMAPEVGSPALHVGATGEINQLTCQGLYELYNKIKDSWKFDHGTHGSFNKVNLTPIRIGGVNSAGSTPGEMNRTLNQTISIPASSIQKLDQASTHQVAQTPGAIELGAYKILYIIMSNGKVVPLKVQVNNENIEALHRIK